MHVTERARHHAPDAVILQQTLSGVHTGTWQALPASGRRFEVEVCTVYQFDDAGMLASEHVYFDVAWLARQLTR